MRRQFPYKKIITLAILLAASVSLMNVTGRPQDGPSFWGLLFQRVSRPAYGVWSGIKAKVDSAKVAYADKRDLSRRYQELESQITTIDYLRARIIEAEAENARLRELLAFQNASPGRYKVAEVLGRDPSKWFSSVTLAAGSAEGVRQDAAVVSQAGLVGRILSLSDHASTALLLTDPASGVGAAVQRSRDLGVVLGSGSPDVLTARFFSKDADVRVGDIMVTSGVGSKFTGGILIGEVISVQAPQPGLVKEATIRPAADLTHLEEVMVIVK